MSVLCTLIQWPFALCLYPYPTPPHNPWYVIVHRAAPRRAIICQSMTRSTMSYDVSARCSIETFCFLPQCTWWRNYCLNWNVSRSKPRWSILIHEPILWCCNLRSIHVVWKQVIIFFFVWINTQSLMHNHQSNIFTEVCRFSFNLCND